MNVMSILVYPPISLSKAKMLETPQNFMANHHVPHYLMVLFSGLGRALGVVNGYNCGILTSISWDAGPYNYVGHMMVALHPILYSYHTSPHYIFTCKYIYMYTYIYICIHIYICIYICKYVYIYICVIYARKLRQRQTVNMLVQQKHVFADLCAVQKNSNGYIRCIYF